MQHNDTRGIKTTTNTKRDLEKTASSKSSEVLADKNNDEKASEINKKYTKKFKLVLNIILGTFAVGVYGGVTYNLNQYHDLAVELDSINESLASEQKIQQDFEEEVQYLRSDDYIEKVAREQLGMIKPTEILYINNS